MNARESVIQEIADFIELYYDHDTQIFGIECSTFDDPEDVQAERIRFNDLAEDFEPILNALAR